MDLMKLFGVAGLLFITAGILIKDRKKEYYFLIAGGILLEIYSIYIEDIIFIVLEAIFIAAAVYDLSKQKYIDK